MVVVDGGFPSLLLHLMVVAFGMRLLARRKRCSSSSSFSKRPSFLAPGFYEVRKEEEKPNCPRRCISPSPKVTNSLWGLLFSSPPMPHTPRPPLSFSRTHTHTHTHTHTGGGGGGTRAPVIRLPTAKEEDHRSSLFAFLSLSSLPLSATTASSSSSSSFLRPCELSGLTWPDPSKSGRGRGRGSSRKGEGRATLE